MLLRAINLTGKLYMVPAIVNDDYVIRFAVCAPNAKDDDIDYAWDVISDTARDVSAACAAESDEENEALKEIRRIESVESDDVGPLERSLEDEEGDEVFLFDNNIPSVPSLIPVLPKTPAEAMPNYPRRRNQLLRMISDPKCYNPKLLRSFSHEDPTSPRPLSHTSGAAGRPSGLFMNGTCNGLDKSQ